jgi:KaiC/GvpD/RAD55 family RecA-like ATPase
LSDDENPPDSEQEDDQEPELMENGGSEVAEVNVPQPMRKYMVALQRTLIKELGGFEYEEEGPSEVEMETARRTEELDRLAIEPEELKEIQETFNVHSIEELLETLKMKEEELIRIKSDFSIKMRNSLALQRIKFEKELNDMKKRMEQYSQFTDAESFLKKREEEFRKKERSLQQQEEELEELKSEVETLRATKPSADGEVVAAEGKDASELREILEEQAMEVSQLETQLSRTRTELEESSEDREREKRRYKEVQEELDNLKKGSVAMMKYVTTVQRKKSEEEVVDLKRNLEEERKKRKELEEELQNKESALRARDLDVDQAISQAVSAGAKGVDLDTIAKLNQQLRQKTTAMEARERELKLKERKIVAELRKLKEERARVKKEERKALDDEMAALPQFQEQLLEKDEMLRDYRSQVDVLNEELSKLKKAVSYKDEEFARRQQELDYKSKLMEEEMHKLKEAKIVAGGSTDVLDARKEVERLEKVIGQKEEELKTKEAFLAGKERELQMKEQAVIEDHLEVAATDREAEMKANKVKTGTARLDDLLFGGLPMGANVLITGPPFIGKEILIESFIVDGITKGIPGVLVLSDVSPAEMRESLSNHVSSIEEYERLGLVKYIDAYSIPMGVDPEEGNPHITYLSEATAYQEIIGAMDKLTKEFRKAGHDYFRVTVNSISTFITYSDVKATYGFLQKLTGRLKRTNAVSLYPVDEGMHTQTDIQMLGHVMDGSFHFKAENLKTYIAIQGVCDTQSRDWIQYQYTKKGLNIGSFTLTHIR